MRSVLAAMESVGVRRLVGLAGGAVNVPGERKPITGRITTALVRLMARNVVEAKQREFDIVRRSGLDWTDGTGYFRGLGGESLGLGARIVAVSDVYEALTADRPYRAAWSPERALEVMRLTAGQILGADIVEAIPDVVA